MTHFKVMIKRDWVRGRWLPWEHWMMTGLISDQVKRYQSISVSFSTVGGALTLIVSSQWGLLESIPQYQSCILVLHLISVVEQFLMCVRHPTTQSITYWVPVFKLESCVPVRNKNLTSMRQAWAAEFFFNCEISKFKTIYWPVLLNQTPFFAHLQLCLWTCRNRHSTSETQIRIFNI